MEDLQKLDNECNAPGQNWLCMSDSKKKWLWWDHYAKGVSCEGNKNCSQFTVIEHGRCSRTWHFPCGLVQLCWSSVSHSWTAHASTPTWLTVYTQDVDYTWYNKRLHTWHPFADDKCETSSYSGILFLKFYQTEQCLCLLPMLVKADDNVVFT
jgi:hypothetical protein